MKKSKRYRQVKEKIIVGKIYTLEEGINLVKESPVKFDAAVEVHFKLGVDTKKSDQTVRGTVKFPHKTGKQRKILALVVSDKVAEAKEAGADIVGGIEIIEEIKKTSRVDADIVVASPEMMRKLAPVAKILGQRGLMPNPKTETVGVQIGKIIKELKSGKAAFRADDGGNVHFCIGRVSYETRTLLNNVRAAIQAVIKAKPVEAKSTYFLNTTISASMGPGIRVSF